MTKLSDSMENMRQNYQHDHLYKKDVASSPFVQFENWFQQVMESSKTVYEHNAMTLATVDADGQPSARIVLLKGFDSRGFVFYTSYLSRKGRALALNPKISLSFYWPTLERQVRIEGQVERLSEEDSTRYFQSRPRKSQIGAWTSPQSELIDSRLVLDQKREALEKEFEGLEVLPKPEFWGGYLVVPSYFEFWQGRSSRLHDRIVYRLLEGVWEVGRVAP